jgi:hypothetical protein
MGKISKLRDSGINTKVAATAGKSTIDKSVSQKITGKLGGGMESCPGGVPAGKGGPIKAAPSNPIAGKTKSSGSEMGATGVIGGFV